VDIVTNEQKGVLLVPDRVIKEDSEGNPVVKVMMNDQVEERLVSVGLTDGDETEIVQGLSDGEEVIMEVKVKIESSGAFGG